MSEMVIIHTKESFYSKLGKSTLKTEELTILEQVQKSNKPNRLWTTAKPKRARKGFSLKITTMKFSNTWLLLTLGSFAHGRLHNTRDLAGNNQIDLSNDAFTVTVTGK